MAGDALSEVRRARRTLDKRWPRGVGKPAQDLKDVRQMFGGISSYMAGDSRFAAQALMFIAERLASIEELLATPPTAPGKRRPASAWNRFFAAGMKAGKSPQQIGQEWRARKARAA